jgi:hypothetical protein
VYGCLVPRLLDAARTLGVRAAIPRHFDGWAHFTDGFDELETAIDRGVATDTAALCH